MKDIEQQKVGLTLVRSTKNNHIKDLEPLKWTRVLKFKQLTDVEFALGSFNPTEINDSLVSSNRSFDEKDLKNNSNAVVQMRKLGRN